MSFLLYVVTLALYCACVGECQLQQRPNIVIIVADDLGWDDVSFHNSEILTPNIDYLAYTGIILNNYYVNPICTPSRGALMTGKYPIHTGLQTGVIGGPTPYGLGLNHTIMAEYLKRLGYTCRIVGKWHLGFFAKEYTPTFRGFDSHFGYWTGHEDYYDHTSEDYYWGLDLRRNMMPVINEREQYATELFSNEAEKIIRNHNTSEPLFLYLAHLAVHAGNFDGDPVQAPQRYISRFPYIKDLKRRIFAGMVAALDDSVGNVTRALMETGMMNNTIIVFTTDNGGPANNYDRNAACNWPLRGVKNTLWEGGTRGTGFIYSPLLKKSGYINNNLLHISDWLPTLYSAVGGNVKDLVGIDGHDAWEMLSDNGQSVRDDLVLNIDPIANTSAYRQGEWKLIYGSDRNSQWYPCTPTQNLGQNRKFVLEQKRDPRVITVDCGERPFNYSTNCDPVAAPCLFHISSDPCEYTNLASEHPDILQRLLKRLKEYESTMVPPANKPVDPRADPKNFGGIWTPWIEL